MPKQSSWMNDPYMKECLQKAYSEIPTMYPELFKTIPKESGIDPEELRKMVSEGTVGKVVVNTGFNEPQHYHQHDIDTIEFLQRGFPPDVFMGFAIGHVVKYAQRSKYKGTPREDLVKMVDYAKRALDWYDKTHS
jgi:hypothetical protein